MAGQPSLRRLGPGGPIGDDCVHEPAARPSLVSPVVAWVGDGFTLAWVVANGETDVVMVGSACTAAMEVARGDVQHLSILSSHDEAAILWTGAALHHLLTTRGDGTLLSGPRVLGRTPEAPWSRHAIIESLQSCTVTSARVVCADVVERDTGDLYRTVLHGREISLGCEENPLQTPTHRGRHLSDTGRCENDADCRVIFEICLEGLCGSIAGP